MGVDHTETKEKVALRGIEAMVAIYKMALQDKRGCRHPRQHNSKGTAMNASDKKMVSDAISQMIRFYDGSVHDIEHFLKVWAYARTIGIQEGLDDKAQRILELASIVHDIACPLCRKKYGNTNGNHQQTEGVPLTREFYKGYPITADELDRICILVGHHHTYANVDGMDYQILLEADFLVNASESSYGRTQIEAFREKVFKTKTGLGLLDSIYKLGRM